MRVALLAWDWPAVPTGLARAAREIAEGLAAAGAEVVVLAGDRPAGTRERDGGVEVAGAAPGGALARLRRLAAVGHLAAPLAFARALRVETARRPIDVVEATNWYAPAALVRTVPLVVRCSTPAIEAGTAGLSARDRLDLAAAHRLEAAAARRGASVIANTRPHAERIVALYRLARAPEVVELAIPARLLALGARAGPGAAAPPWRLAFVGRAEGRKGFAEALDALARLRAAGRPVELHGVGLDAAEAAMHLAALAPETRAGVVLHGRLDDAAMARVLASAHLVLAPSRYESYGYVYREAGAFARPLVASAEDPSARAYLGETGAGLLAAATEGAAIAEAVARLLDAPALAARLGARGRAHVEGLDPGALARRTLAIYETAVGRGRAVVKDRGA